MQAGSGLCKAGVKVRWGRVTGRCPLSLWWRGQRITRPRSLGSVLRVMEPQSCPREVTPWQCGGHKGEDTCHLLIADSDPAGRSVVPTGAPQCSHVLVPRPHLRQQGIVGALKKGMEQRIPEGRRTKRREVELEWNRSLKQLIKGSSHTAPLPRTSPFQNLPQHLGAGPLLQSLRPQHRRGNSPQTREPRPQCHKQP